MDNLPEREKHQASPGLGEQVSEQEQSCPDPSQRKGQTRTILETLRSKHDQKILRLRAEYLKCLEEMKDNEALENTRWFQRATQASLLLGTKDLNYAPIGTLDGSILGSGSSSVEDAAVLYMTADEFAKYSKENATSMEKPIVIPGEPEAPPEEFMARFIDALEISCARNSITVQDLSLSVTDEDGDAADSFRLVPANTVIAQIKKPQKELSNKLNTLPINLLDLQDFNLVNPPAFLNEPRYQLLRYIDERVEADVRQQALPKRQRVKNPTLMPGKKHFQVRRPADVAGCQRFTIYAQRGAYSGAHADSLNGTWVKCLKGLKIWIIFPKLHDGEDQSGFESQGSDWIPQNPEDAQMIVLTPGDVLIMPAGEAVVHAPITAEDALMIGGMYWDTQTICAIVGNMGWILENPAVSNERNLLQLPAMLEKLNAFVHEYPEKFINENLDKKAFLKEWKQAHDSTTKILRQAKRAESKAKKPIKSKVPQKRRK